MAFAKQASPGAATVGAHGERFAPVDGLVGTAPRPDTVAAEAGDELEGGGQSRKRQWSKSGMRDPNAVSEPGTLEAEMAGRAPALILIVEDEAPVRRLLTWAMAGKGWDVRSAPDAETALRQIGELRPDVLLVDVRLPGMDGVEFARAVRAEPALADLPLVLMSAYERPRQELADGFIAKPFDVDYLALFVASLIGRRRRT